MALAWVAAVVIMIAVTIQPAIATGVESHNRGYAEWRTREGFFRVHVWQFESVDGGLSTTLDIAKGTCRRLAGGGTLCEPTREKRIAIPDRSFRVDEDGAMATLDAHVLGRRTLVQWDGKSSEPYLVLEGGACPDSDIGGTGVGWARDVRASGRVLGRLMNPTSEAMLIQTTYANPC